MIYNLQDADSRNVCQLEIANHVNPVKVATDLAVRFSHKPEAGIEIRKTRGREQYVAYYDRQVILIITEEKN